MLTISDLTPLALALVTQELLDSKRFRKNFCDTLLLGGRERLQPQLLNLKRELNLSETGKKFFEGYKATLLFSLDKIIGLARRYTNVDSTAVQKIVSTCKEVMESILRAENFEQISELGLKFKSEVTLKLFTLMKEARV